MLRAFRYGSSSSGPRLPSRPIHKTSGSAFRQQPVIVALVKHLPLPPSRPNPHTMCCDDEHLLNLLVEALFMRDFLPPRPTPPFFLSSFFAFRPAEVGVKLCPRPVMGQNRSRSVCGAWVQAERWRAGKQAARASSSEVSCHHALSTDQ